jgi:hypothetical protein
MTTARDFELGERPTCAACGRELDVETDCHHDGYEGSPHAHGGRGSYGMGSHHFVFSDYCEFCADAPEPLRAILQYDSNWEWLECGHKLSTPYNRFGRIRPGNRRRCCKCKRHSEPEFTAAEILRAQRKEAFVKKLQRQRHCSIAMPFRTTESNWNKYLTQLGLTFENCELRELAWYVCKKTERASKLQAALREKADFDKRVECCDWAYNSDDH